MKKNYSLLALALLTSMISHQAQAASSSSASIGPISIQLFDLNPSDSITPAIKWNIATQSLYGNVSTPTATGSIYFTASGSAPTSLFSSQQLNAPLNIVKNIIGTGSASVDTVPALANNPSGLSVSVAGNVQNAGAYRASYQLMSNGYPNQPVELTFAEFLLTPNTLALFSANAQASAITTVGYHPSGSEEANASGSLYVSTTTTCCMGLYNGQSSNSVISAWAGSVNSTSGPTSSFNSGLLNANFTNSTNVELSGRLTLFLQASGSTHGNYTPPVNPVPEPETYAMLLAGLSILGALKRKKL
ncbi:MAG: PEP-CTERM sorting domain-containing protein [Pseudomonadota bacterium]